VGLAIAGDTIERNRGSGSFAVRETMELRNRQGQESRREPHVKVLEVERDGDRSLFIFDEPCDVVRAAMLIHGQMDAADGH